MLRFGRPEIGPEDNLREDKHSICRDVRHVIETLSNISFPPLKPCAHILRQFGKVSTAATIIPLLPVKQKRERISTSLKADRKLCTVESARHSRCDDGRNQKQEPKSQAIRPGQNTTKKIAPNQSHRLICWRSGPWTCRLISFCLRHRGVVDEERKDYVRKTNFNTKRFKTPRNLSLGHDLYQSQQKWLSLYM